MIKTNPLFNELTADNIMKRGNLMDGRERERARERERERESKWTVANYQNERAST